jgi:hypothetical protein
MTGPTKAEEMADAEFIQEARADVPYLLGVVERLTDENQALRLGAIQDEGLWSSQDAGLRAEVERLTAERDSERARLEAAVVEAALAERRAELAYDAMAASVWPSQYDTETTRAVYASRKAYEAAVDALLAFVGEGQ